MDQTHWHIAAANGLARVSTARTAADLSALISPDWCCKEFALTVPEYRSGLQIAWFFGIAVGRGEAIASDGVTLLAVNIALFSLLMPVAADVADALQSPCRDQHQQQMRAWPSPP